MTQIVGYYEDDVTFTEGPFVLTTLHGPGDCRIEVDHGGKCPVTIGREIRDLLVAHFRLGNRPLRGPVEALAPYVDWLNAEFKAGRIARNAHGAPVPKDASS